MKKLQYISSILTLPAISFASGSELNTGDTAWVLISTALVMSMTPAGLALFYGGMTRAKNILNTIGMSFAAYALVSVIWVLWGYSLAFGPSIGGIIGSLKYALFNGITVSDVSGTIPTLLFAAFQMTFACITVALVSGSVIERLKFSAWVVFSILWVTFAYSPVCHWVWGGGFMEIFGALDFAGGTVVHINAGIAGLVLALMLGKRRDHGKAMFPSSVVLTGLGAALLWFGWFGFNAGSELAADGIAANALLVTNTSAAAGVIGWIAMEWLHAKRPTVLGVASGAIAGLVAITPAAGFVNAGSSIIIGFIAGLVGFFGVFILKQKLGYDDSLDAFGVHGLAGLWGAIATGIFADPDIGGVAGMIFGNPELVTAQLITSMITAAYSAITTFIIVKVTGVLTGGIRATEESEHAGLDEAVHGEKGFNLQP